MYINTHPFKLKGIFELKDIKHFKTFDFNFYNLKNCLVHVL